MIKLIIFQLVNFASISNNWLQLFSINKIMTLTIILPIISLYQKEQFDIFIFVMFEMNSRTFRSSLVSLVLFTLFFLSSNVVFSAQFLSEKLGTRWCLRGDILGISQGACDEFNDTSIRLCLRRNDLDKEISELLIRCPDHLPNNIDHGRYDRYAFELVNNRMLNTFTAYITQGGCRLSGPQVRQQLGRYAMQLGLPEFENVLGAICDRAAKDVQMVTKPMAPIQAGLPPTPPIGVGLVPTSPHTPLDNAESITAHQVQMDPTILSRLTPLTAPRFGLLTNACRGLTEAHFRQPGISPTIIALLPLQCFVLIPGPAFSGLDTSMIARIRYWPFVTGQQIRFVRDGAPIRSLPFDQLGVGRQHSRHDRIHPCYWVTKDQLKSIKRRKETFLEYKKRCLRSFAIGKYQNMGYSTILLSLLLVILF